MQKQTKHSMKRNVVQIVYHSNFLHYFLNHLLFFHSNMMSISYLDFVLKQSLKLQYFFFSSKIQLFMALIYVSKHFLFWIHLVLISCVRKLFDLFGRLLDWLNHIQYFLNYLGYFVSCAKLDYLLSFIDSATLTFI